VGGRAGGAWWWRLTSMVMEVEEVYGEDGSGVYSHYKGRMSPHTMDI